MTKLIASIFLYLSMSKRRAGLFVFLSFWVLILSSNSSGFEEDTVTEYVEGQLFVKVKENVEIDIRYENGDFVSIHAEDPISFIGKFGIQKISKPFALDDYRLQQTYLVEFDAKAYQNTTQLIQEFLDLAFVEYAEQVPNYALLLTPNDLDANQWGLPKIQAELAWDITTGSSNVVIAIVDDAVLLSHEDLAPVIWVNPGETLNGIDDDGNGYVDDINGWDVADNDNDPNPPGTVTNSNFTHGTHCAGIAAAATDNGIGIASISYNVRIMAVKSKTDASSGGSLQAPYLGVQYAIAAGADIISMSWGGSGFSQTYQILFDVANANGIVLVAAAGNSNSSIPFYPAAYNNIISVGATDIVDQKASFSNYGTTLDVVAPGKDIWSCLAGSNNSYGNLSGTSMACPLVSGLVGLMLSQNSLLTPSEIEACLESTCDNIDAQNPSYIGLLGAGRINANQALQCIKAITADFQADAVSVCPGVTVNFTDLSNNNPTAWQWTFSGGTPSTSNVQNPSITYNTPGTYDVTLIVTNANGSDTLTKSVYIDVAVPTAVISGSTTILAGYPTTLTVNLTGNPPWSITYSDGSGTYTINNIMNSPYSLVVSPDTSTSYNLVAVSDNGCSGSFLGSATVMVNYIGAQCDSVFISAGVDSSICGSDSISLNGFVAGVTNYLSTKWQGGLGTYIPSADSLNTIYIPTASEILSGQVTLTLTVLYETGSVGIDTSMYTYEHGGNDRIVNINLLTGNVTDIMTNNGYDWTAMTHDAGNNLIYGFPGIVSAKGFHILDLATLIVTPITTFNTRVFGAAYDNFNQKLYAVGVPTSGTFMTQTLYDVNTSTGALTAIGPLGPLVPATNIFAAPGDGINGLAYDPGGDVLFGISSDSGDVYSIDVSTGAATLLGNTGLVGFRGMTYDYNANKLYAISNCSTVYEINTNNGSIISTIVPQPVACIITALTFLGSSGGSGLDTVACTDTIIISIDNFTVNLSPDTTICVGDSVEIGALTFDCGKSPFTYSWSPSTGLSDPNIANPKASPLLTTTYNLTVSDGLGLFASNSVVITVDTACCKSYALIGSSSNYCLGDTVFLTNTSIAKPGATYNWNFGGGSPGSFTGTNPPPVYYSTEGAYQVELILNDICNADTAYQDIFIFPLPVAEAGNDTSMCVGDTIRIGSSPISNFTYSWAPSTGLDNTSVSNPFASPGTSISYILTVTDEVSGCSNLDTINMNVNVVPTISITPDAIICLGDSISLTATGGSTILWSTGDTSSVITVTPLDTTTYSVSVSNGICIAFDSVTVNVDSVPMVTISGNNNICEGATTTLTATGVGDFVWSTGDSVSTITVNPAITTTYSIASTNSCGAAADSITITVNPVPVLSLSSDTAICAGNSVTLMASGGSSTLWSTGETTASIVVVPMVTTIYSVTISNGVCGATDSVAVSVDPVPSVTISGGNDICAGEATTLTATGVGSLMWSTGDSTGSLTVTPVTSTMYTVTATNSCGEASDSLSINVSPVPVIDAGLDVSIVLGSESQLNASSTSAVISYSWTPMNGLSCTACQAPVASPVSTTTYTVVGADAFGCSALDQITITVDLTSTFFLPDIFSPNNDDSNDFLYVQGKGILYAGLTVYDRWGKKVFEKFNMQPNVPTVGWDGSYKGKPLNPAVFVYYLQVVFINGGTQTEKGDVTLFR